MPSDENRLHPEHAPTPFSADEIRRACSNGRVIRHSIQSGNSQFHQETSFGRATGDNCEITVRNYDLTGKMLGKANKSRAAWIELQRHASFPAENTVIQEWKGETAVGWRSGWKYVVKASKQGQIHVSTFIFARDLPGPPVEFTQTVDGLPKYRMVLVDDKR